VTVPYFDRDGRPISLDRFAELHADHSYKIVAQDGINCVWVSTVWIGLPYLLMIDPPLIFETMTFSPVREEWDGCVVGRYQTAPSALVGHLFVCAAVRSENLLTP
jgi:hypothetical protein